MITDWPASADLLFKIFANKLVEVICGIKGPNGDTVDTLLPCRAILPTQLWKNSPEMITIRLMLLCSSQHYMKHRYQFYMVGHFTLL